MWCIRDRERETETERRETERRETDTYFSYYLLSIVPFPPFSPLHTHYIPSFYPPPIVCPSNGSQGGFSERTALAYAISYAKDGKPSEREGCKECVAALRDAGAKE